MRKIKAEEWILAAAFFLLTFLSMFFFAYLAQSYQLNVESMGLYSRQTTYFSTDTPLTRETLQTSVKNAVLYAEIDMNEEIRAVYLQGKIVPPPMESGRYFTASDFETNKRTAVIGKGYQERLTKENGKSVFYYQGEAYEVIGTLGTRQPSRLDRICLLSYQDALAAGGGSPVYALDAADRASQRETMEALQASGLQTIDRETRSISSFFEGESVGFLLFLLTAAFFVCANLFLALYWIDKRKKQIAVMRLVGYSDRAVCRAILKQFGLLTLVGCASGGIGSLLLIYLLHYAPISPFYILLVYGLILLCFFLCTALPVKKALRYSVISILR